jgi:hypothetical protein
MKTLKIILFVSVLAAPSHSSKEVDNKDGNINIEENDFHNSIIKTPESINVIDIPKINSQMTKPQTLYHDKGGIKVR